MRTTILQLLLVLLPIISTGQVRTGYENFDIKINLGCGYAGARSQELKVVGKLFREQNLSGLLDLMKTSDSLTQLLCVIAIDELGQNATKTMLTTDYVFISEYKAKKEVVYTCNGCTGHNLYTVEELFTPSANPARRRIGQYLMESK